MASQAEDDLEASQTQGFTVGEKKTVEEYAKLGESTSKKFKGPIASERLPARYSMVMVCIATISAG